MEREHTAEVIDPSSSLGRQTVDTDELPRRPPLHLGRYVILDPLGAGGMGAVYGAWDRELQRRVAIKVMHSDDRERFLREAQALARLHHPNVVTVHDVGSSEGQDYLAMELVEGQTLRRWLEQPRPWRDVLDVFRQAGRGLAAAHAAGLVHRDFKPDNVLLGDDGAVRVADFGLARSTAALASSSETPAAGVHAPLRDDLLVGSLTVSGARVGTPRYMAPEQHAGRDPDPAMDQYSFCLALWEGLYGRQPGESRTALLPATGRVPSWLRVTLQRGLSVAPAARFPSLDALLVALARDRSRARRWGVALLATIAAGAALALVPRRAAGPVARPCAGAERRLDGVWDPAVKARVRAAFASSGRPYAEHTFANVARTLDEHGAAWVAMRTEACEATFVRHDQSAGLLDLRMACLDRRLGELRALTLLFTRADGPLVDNAVGAVYRLGDLGPCADAHALSEAIPPPSDRATAERVVALRERLQQADALMKSGRYREAGQQLGGLIEEVRALGYEPLVGETILALGGAQLYLGDAAAAEATLDEAMPILARSKDDLGLATGWIRLVTVIGSGQSRPAEALALKRAAEAAIVRAGGDGRRQAVLDLAVGQLLKLQGRYAEALVSERRALALDEALLDPRDPALAAAHNSIGVVLVAQRQYDEAITEYQATLDLLTNAYGDDHPSVAGVMINLGNLDNQRGRHGEAVSILERALAIQERTVGPDHPDVAKTLLNLAAARMALDDLEGARKDVERSLAIRERKLTPDHLETALSLMNLGLVQLKLQRPTEALPVLERSLAIREKVLGPTHLLVAESLSDLGDALSALGRREAARRAFERALRIERQQVDGAAGGDIDEATTLSSLGELLLTEGRVSEALATQQRVLAMREAALGADHPDVGRSLVTIGELLLRGGRAAAAVPALERALAILESRGAPPLATAEARFALARALWARALAPDRPRALALGAEARRGLAAGGASSARLLEELDLWSRGRR